MGSKTSMVSLPDGGNVRWYVPSFGYNTATWQTDRNDKTISRFACCALWRTIKRIEAKNTKFGTQHNLEAPRCGHDFVPESRGLESGLTECLVIFASEWMKDDVGRLSAGWRRSAARTRTDHPRRRRRPSSLGAMTRGGRHRRRATSVTGWVGQSARSPATRTATPTWRRR